MLLTQHIDKGKARTFCDAFINSKRLKFVFGINQYSESIAECVDINGFIDDFTSSKEYLGKPIVKLENIPKEALVISAVTMKPFVAEKKLNSFGIEFLDYFSFYKYSEMNLTNINFWEGFEEDFYKNRAQYEHIYSMLADNESKDTFKKLINFKLSYDLNCMRGFEDLLYRQYFEDFLNLNQSGEVFADIGGFDGYTSQEFIKRCPDYKSILFFEPFEKNMLIAEQNLSGHERIDFYQIGLSNRNDFICLMPNESASKFSENGSVKIPIKRLDDVVDKRITFLKMDIEGAESEAIEGAERTILEQHPRLAISVYHKPTDFWAIPQQLLNIRDDYNIFMRHYTEGSDETVMFFIPRK